MSNARDVGRHRSAPVIASRRLKDFDSSTSSKPSRLVSPTAPSSRPPRRPRSHSRSGKPLPRIRLSSARARWDDSFLREEIRAVLDKFVAFAIKKGLHDWHEVTREILSRYGKWLEEQDYGDATQYLELTTLKQVLKWMVSENLLRVSSSRSS